MFSFTGYYSGNLFLQFLKDISDHYHDWAFNSPIPRMIIQEKIIHLSPADWLEQKKISWFPLIFKETLKFDKN